MKAKKKSTHPKAAAKSSGASGQNNQVLKVVLIVVGVILLLGVIGAAAGAYVFGSWLKRAAQPDSVSVGKKSVEIKGQDGNSVAIGENAQLPEGFPTDIPLYPGAKLIMANKNGQTYTATLTSTDEYSKVKAYYQAELAKNGWANKNQDTALGGDSGQASNFAKANRGLILILSAPSTNQKVTGISIAVTTKAGNSNSN